MTSGSLLLQALSECPVPVMIRHRPLAMERIDPAYGAEEMPRHARVPVILAEHIRARQQGEGIFMHAGHQRAFHTAQRTVTPVDIADLRRDAEPDRAAMAGAFILGHAFLACVSQAHITRCSRF